MTYPCFLLLEIVNSSVGIAIDLDNSKLFCVFQYPGYETKVISKMAMV